MHCSDDLVAAVRGQLEASGIKADTHGNLLQSFRNMDVTAGPAGTPRSTANTGNHSACACALCCCERTVLERRKSWTDFSISQCQQPIHYMLLGCHMNSHCMWEQPGPACACALFCCASQGGMGQGVSWLDSVCSLTSCIILDVYKSCAVTSALHACCCSKRPQAD